jgi:hypothetical protein
MAGKFGQITQNRPQKMLFAEQMAAVKYKIWQKVTEKRPENIMAIIYWETS